jgi:ubiquinone/menaquinone biosynthesis C-methylase UbiE
MQSPYENAYHETRFGYDAQREVLWKTLCDSYFSALIKPDATVLELGAGYCHFINNVSAGERVAVDLWPEFPRYAQAGVRAIVGSVTQLDRIEDASVDFTFASNVFEHLTHNQLADTLREIRRVSRPGATLTLLQPNYKYAWKEYFDDYTHVSVFSDTSLCDFLTAHQYRVVERQARFLPLSIKSRWPVSPLLIRAYLASPVKFLAKQMLIRSTPF